MMRDRSIKFATRVKAPVAVVFEALTQPAVLARWFPSKAATDPRPGGKYTYTFVYKNNPEAPTLLQGEFSEVERDKRVSYTWPVGRAGAMEMTTVEFALTDLCGETEIALSHSGFGRGNGWDETYDRHAQGWTAFMVNIKTVLERGEDQREKLMGMLV